MVYTSIGWADRTWNPVVGCSRLSDGCRHCYAEQMAGTRLSHLPDYAGLTRMVAGEPRWTGEVRLLEDRLSEPLHWRKPYRVFVNSMSDLFHESLSEDDIREVLEVIYWVGEDEFAEYPNEVLPHQFLCLTKRAKRMRDVVTQFRADMGELEPEPNVWLGVSVENQSAADERIPFLLDTFAVVRWLSVEPLLEKIEIPRLDELDWVVVGGESGNGYRPMEIDWLVDVVEQCYEDEVPVFVKQDSGRMPGQQGRIPDEIWARKEYPR